MKHFKRFFAFFLVALLFVLQFACSPNMVALAVTPTLVATAKATATPTPKSVPTETPTPTPTIDQESEIMAQKKQDFINKTGDYAYENIKDSLFNNGLEVGYQTYDLGVVSYFECTSGTQITIQGWLFDYRVKDSNLILEIGFDNKDSTKGIIKEVIIPVDFYQQHFESGIGLSLLSYEFWKESDSSLTFLGMENDIEIIKNYLYEFKDQPILFGFYSEYFVSDETTNIFGETTDVDLNKLINDNSSSVNQLLTEIPNNKIDIEIGNTNAVDSSHLILLGITACFE